MNRFCEKVYLEIDTPTEDDPSSDQKRIIEALNEAGYENVKMPLSVIGKLYPMCRNCEYKITVTLCFCDDGWTITDVQERDTTTDNYGLAMDYGSTTMLMELVDLNSGEILAKAQETNGQVKYGTDILTRITFTMRDKGNSDVLQNATVKTFERLFDTLTEKTGINVRELPVLIVSGNTTMIHFLLNLDAWTVFASPYAPVTMDPGFLWGKELGMSFNGLIYCIPSASNYVGGDIVSGLLNLGIRDSEEIQLFFDIGTNGELVIGNKDWIMAGAGAAGPALEGYISKYGIQARPGAIDTVTISDNKFAYTTIGGDAPVGICGSGIIDLLAQMRISGWIDIAGNLNPEASDNIREIEGEYAVIYAFRDESGLGEDLYFSQTDIRQYLDTKAAAYTMIECLLDMAGCPIEEIDKCCLSGSFSAHSNLEHAITIGIFPDFPREKYSCIKNASLDGARALLLDRDRMEDIRYFRDHMYCAQFASVPDFLIRMQAAKFIPHTDAEKFPIITEKLKR